MDIGNFVPLKKVRSRLSTRFVPCSVEGEAGYETYDPKTGAWVSEPRRLYRWAGGSIMGFEKEI